MYCQHHIRINISSLPPLVFGAAISKIDIPFFINV